MTTEAPAAFVFELLAALSTVARCFPIHAMRAAHTVTLEGVLPSRQRRGTTRANQSGGMYHLWNLNAGGFVCPTPQTAAGLPSAATNCGDRDARLRMPQMWAACHESRAT